MAENANNNDFPTILGPDASFKGELHFEKGMRLMGKFEGKMTTPGRVHIAKEAHMAANVESGSIIVEGSVNGNLTANDRIELKNTARYEGDLQATKLVVEDGAIFSGHVQVGPEAMKNNAQRPGGANAAVGPNGPHVNRLGADAKAGSDAKNDGKAAPHPVGQK